MALPLPGDPALRIEILLLCREVRRAASAIEAALHLRSAHRFDADGASGRSLRTASPTPDRLVEPLPFGRFDYGPAAIGPWPAGADRDAAPDVVQIAVGSDAASARTLELARLRTRAIELHCDAPRASAMQVHRRLAEENQRMRGDPLAPNRRPLVSYSTVARWLRDFGTRRSATEARYAASIGTRFGALVPGGSSARLMDRVRASERVSPWREETAAPASGRRADTRARRSTTGHEPSRS